MRFRFVDRIVAWEPGVRIQAVKALSLAEDYLRDHFPLFPVMPGVLMLEAMYETAAWLIRASEDFAHSAVLLKEARNVKYADFVAPGQVLAVTAEVVREEGLAATLNARGAVDGRTAASARLVLERCDISSRLPRRTAGDAYARERYRREFQLLCGGGAPTAS